MRLGKDVLQADLYGELGLLPDATESEIRIAYRRHVRTSHPDLNPDDASAVQRMSRLNVSAKVLLDPALRRAYDRARQSTRSTSSSSAQAGRTRSAHWYEQREQSGDDEWSAPRPEERERGASFGTLFGELRSREGQLSLQVQELVDSLSVRQQLGFSALLFALALGLIVMARPQSLIGNSAQPTSIDPGSVYP